MKAMNKTQALTTEGLADAVRRIAARLETQADKLNALDGQLGDGDLGVTLTRGFFHLTQALPLFTEDVGEAFAICARSFTKESGSSFGTLLAFAFTAAAKKAKSLKAVPWSDVSLFLAAALEAMMNRGKASLGDKTMLDVIDAARHATEGLDDPATMLDAVLAATDETISRMRSLPARTGRARIFGERSKGLDDPGMIAFREILEAIRA